MDTDVRGRGVVVGVSGGEGRDGGLDRVAGDGGGGVFRATRGSVTTPSLRPTRRSTRERRRSRALRSRDRSGTPLRPAMTAFYGGLPPGVPGLRPPAMIAVGVPRRSAATAARSPAPSGSGCREALVSGAGRKRSHFSGGIRRRNSLCKAGSRSMTRSGVWFSRSKLNEPIVMTLLA